MLYKYDIDFDDGYDNESYSLLSQRRLAHGEFRQMVKEAIEFCKNEYNYVNIVDIKKYLYMAYGDIFVEDMYSACVVISRKDFTISDEYEY